MNFNSCRFEVMDCSIEAIDGDRFNCSFLTTHNRFNLERNRQVPWEKGLAR